MTALAVRLFGTGALRLQLREAKWIRITIIQGKSCPMIMR